MENEILCKWNFYVNYSRQLFRNMIQLKWNWKLNKIDWGLTTLSAQIGLSCLW